MFLPDFVCLFVCLSVYSKITMKLCTDLSEILRVCRAWHKLPVIQFWGWSKRNNGFWITLKFSLPLLSMGHKGTAGKPKMVLPSSEQHCLGRAMRAIWLLPSFLMHCCLLLNTLAWSCCATQRWSSDVQCGDCFGVIVWCQDILNSLISCLFECHFGYFFKQNADNI